MIFFAAIIFLGAGAYFLTLSIMSWRKQRQLEKYGYRTTANVEHVNYKPLRTEVTLTWKDKGQQQQGVATLYGRTNIAKTEKICYAGNHVVLAGRKSYRRLIPSYVVPLFFGLIAFLDGITT